jgi:hypothetical protein
MIKIVTAFLIGTFLTFGMDFLFFLGIKINYFDEIHIRVNFNTLFMENQNSFLYLTLTAILGFLFVYPKDQRLGVVIYIMFLIVSSLTLTVPFVGKEMGMYLFR